MMLYELLESLSEPKIDFYFRNILFKKITDNYYITRHSP